MPEPIPSALKEAPDWVTVVDVVVLSVIFYDLSVEERKEGTERSSAPSSVNSSGLPGGLSGSDLLLQKAQDALRKAVGLAKHCGTCLLKNLQFGERGHFIGHVRVLDAAL